MGWRKVIHHPGQVVPYRNFGNLFPITPTGRQPYVQVKSRARREVYRISDQKSRAQLLALYSYGFAWKSHCND
ncbi:uncharacterized [Tachysurus ichikawai]